jgi:hypothetical protein
MLSQSSNMSWSVSDLKPSSDIQQRYVQFTTTRMCSFYLSLRCIQTHKKQATFTRTKLFRSILWIRTGIVTLSSSVALGTLISYGTSDIGTYYPVAMPQENRTGERRSERHRTGQNRTGQDRTKQDMAGQTGQNKSGNVLWRFQCRNSMSFFSSVSFFSNRALCTSCCCTAIQSCLASDDDNEKNKQTNKRCAPSSFLEGTEASF